MLVNFVKNLNINLFSTKNKFSSLISFLNFNLLFKLFYFMVLFSLFISTNSQSVLLCSFLSNMFDLINPINSFLVFILFFNILSLKNLIINLLLPFLGLKYKINNKTKNSHNNLYIWTIYLFNNISTIFTNIVFFLNNFFFKFQIIISKLFFIQFLLNNFFKLLNRPYWYTIFKRHSIFGYYRISRQRWVELKSEEVNFLKY